MARFKIEGLDAINDAIRQAGEIPWEVESEAIKAMAAVARTKVKATGESMGVRGDDESGVHILDHITTTKPKQTDSGGYSDVTFSGTRTRGNTRTRNAEIAFINEFGKKGQKARPFIRQASEQHADEVAKPGEKIVGDWFEKTLAP